MASFDTESFDVNSFSMEAVGAAAGQFYTEGIQVDESGVVQVEFTTYDYVPISTDIYKLGTLYTFDGIMYVTTNGNTDPGDVFINGIWHTKYGVRHVAKDTTPIGPGVSKGFRTDSSGQQYIETITPSGSISHGILRTSDREMVAEDATP
jgi:hypothetical protein